MAITHYLRQTTKKWHIHNMNQQIIQKREEEWKRHWEKHNKIHQNTTQNKKTEKLLNNNTYIYKKLNRKRQSN